MSPDRVRLLVATPVGGGVVSQDYVHGLVALQAHLARLGWGMEYVSKADGLVTRSRNIFASMVVRDERFTHLLMLDADVVVPPEGIERLVRSGHDVCGCVVPFRTVNWDRVSRMAAAVPGAGPDELRMIAAEYAVRLVPGERTVDGFASVRAIGSAAMLISRQALVAMAASDLVQEATLGLSAADGATGGWTFFETYVDEHGVYLSEDYAFCDRWRRMGGTVQADLHTETQHIGPVVVQGDIAESIRASSAMMEAERAAGISTPER